MRGFALLTACLAAFMLAACGKKPKEPDPTPNTPAPAPAPNTPSPAPKTTPSGNRKLYSLHRFFDSRYKEHIYTQEGQELDDWRRIKEMQNEKLIGYITYDSEADTLPLLRALRPGNGHGYYVKSKPGAFQIEKMEDWPVRLWSSPAADRIAVHASFAESGLDPFFDTDLAKVKAYEAGTQRKVVDNYFYIYSSRPASTPNVDPIPPKKDPPSVPANVDPYEIDWRTLVTDQRREPLLAKAEEAIGELKKAGVDVQTFRDCAANFGAKHLTSDGRLLPEILKSLRTAGVAKLTFSGLPLSDAGLKDCAQLRCLRELIVLGSKLTDAGFAGLKPLTSLEEINITGLEGQPLSITGTGFENLAAASKLRMLWIRKAAVSDAGVAKFSKLPKLVSLDFEDNPLSGTGFKEMAAAKLEWLMLDNCPVSDDGAAALAGMQIQELFLYGSKITDKGVLALVKTKSLKSLRLSATAITENSIKPLASIASLETLDVRNTSLTEDAMLGLAAAPSLKELSVTKGPKVTPAGVEKLKKAKPGLKVEIYN